MTWIVPAGKYQMVTNAAWERKFLLQALTHLLRHNHRDYGCPVSAHRWLVQPSNLHCGAIDVALFVLIIGGFLGVVKKPGQ